MNRKEQLESTRDKIRSATYKLMQECSEASEVTSRRIANEAGVQLAMVNYCFGSREALLFEVFIEKYSTYEMENQIFKQIEKEQVPKEQLRRIYFYVADFLAKECKFTEAITGYTLLHRDLTKGLHTEAFVMAHYKGRKTEAECRLIAYELSSTVQLALCRKKELKEFCGFDFDKEEDLKAYIDLQMELFLAD